MTWRHLLLLVSAASSAAALSACQKIGDQLARVTATPGGKGAASSAPVVAPTAQTAASPTASTSPSPLPSPNAAATVAASPGITGTAGAPGTTAGTPVATASPGGAGPVPARSSAASLQCATWTGPNETKQLQAVLDKASTSNAPYKLTLQPTPQDYFAKLQQLSASGKPPDIVWVDYQYAIPLGSTGALLDVKSTLDKESGAGAANMDDYFAPALDPFRYQGKMYGLPWQVRPAILYANLDIFAKANLGLPDDEWDWSSFLVAAQHLSGDASGKHPTERGFAPDSTRQYGFSVQAGWPPMYLWVWQAGGELVAPDLQTCPIDAEAAARGEQFKADLLNKHQVTPRFSVIAKQGFAPMMANAGIVGMFIGGAADDLDRRPDYKGKGFLLPQGPTGQRTTWAWVGGSAISAKSAAPEAAFRALLDTCDAIQHWKVPAPRKSLATTAALLKAQPEKALSAEAIIASLCAMRARNTFPEYAEWNRACTDQFELPLLNNQDLAVNLAKKVRPQLETFLPT